MPESLVVCQGRSKNSQMTVREAIAWYWETPTEFPEQGTHSGYFYYSLLRSNQLHQLMPCVTSNARMADSTVSCLYAAIPIIFHESPLVAVILAGIPTTLFLYLRQSVLLPLPHRSAHSSCRFCQSPLSQHGSVLDTHHACSPAHWQNVTGSSLSSLYGTGADALDKILLFLSILILALYSFILREVTKRVPF